MKIAGLCVVLVCLTLGRCDASPRIFTATDGDISARVNLEEFQYTKLWDIALHTPIYGPELQRRIEDMVRVLSSHGDSLLWVVTNVRWIHEGGLVLEAPKVNLLDDEGVIWRSRVAYVSQDGADVNPIPIQPIPCKVPWGWCLKVRAAKVVLLFGFPRKQVVNNVERIFDFKRIEDGHVQIQ